MLNKIIVKDIKNRRQTVRKEITKKIMKFILYAERSDSSLRNNMKLLKTLFTSKNNRSNTMNYCIITGRSRGLVRQFKMSRIMLKKLVTKGLLHGVTKSSW